MNRDSMFGHTRLMYISLQLKKVEQRGLQGAGEKVSAEYIFIGSGFLAQE